VFQPEDFRERISYARRGEGKRKKETNDNQNRATQSRNKMSESEDVKNKKGGGDQIKPTEITLET
jgi:hypothetical protein